MGGLNIIFSRVMQSAESLGRLIAILSRGAPKNLENRAALRTAISTVLAVFIALKLHLGAPFWSGITTVVVSNLYTGKIIDKAILRIIGTYAGAFIGLYLASFIANSILLYLLACFFLMCYAVHYYYATRNGYAFLLGGATAIMVISQIAMEPGNVFYIAIWRSAEISVGIVVSAFAAYTIFPNNIHESYFNKINLIFTYFEKEIELLSPYLQGDVAKLAVLNEVNYQMKKDLIKINDIINFMRHETGVTTSIIEKRRALLDLLRDFARHLNYFIYSQHNEVSLQTLMTRQLPINAVLKAINQDLKTLKNAFIHNNTEDFVLLTTPAIRDLDDAFEVHRHQFQESIKLFYQFRHCANNLVALLNCLRLLVINQPIGQGSHFQKRRKTKNLEINVDEIKHNIKSGLSVTLAMFLWLKSEWPGGIDGVISSIVISARKSIFEMKQAAVQRLLGCFLGAGSTLTIMSIIALNLYDFFCILFLLVWAFSYFSFRFSKYSYMGLQANIAIALTLVSSMGPPIYLGPGLERLTGVFIGILASFIISNLLWRTDSLVILERTIENLSRLLSHNVHQILTIEYDERMLHDVTSFIWTSRNLFESLEHENISKKDSERLMRFKNQFASYVFILAIIMQVDRGINKDIVYAFSETLNIDLKGYESIISQGFDKNNLILKDTIMKVIEELTILKNTLIKSLDLSPQALNFIAYLNILEQLARNSYVEDSANRHFVTPNTFD